MKTRLATLTAILATATLALTACAGGSGSTTAQSEQTTQDASASSTRTITDHAGNEVTLPATITRVAIDQIPIESTYLAYFDGKAPYLVGMSAARVKTYTEWMELLEDVFNEDGHMADKIALGKDLVADARARTAKVPEDQRVSTMVLMGAADGQLAVAGGKDGWFTNEWADSLNYTNVSRDTDTSHTPVTFEQVLTWDPQVLLVTGKGMSNMTANSVLSNSVEGVDFSTLSSVKSGRVYSTGLGMWNWFTPNPDAPIVANWIGASLYPEQFSDVDLVAMTKDYYQQMYNFTLTDEQARQIVNPDAAS